MYGVQRYITFSRACEHACFQAHKMFVWMCVCVYTYILFNNICNYWIWLTHRYALNCVLSCINNIVPTKRHKHITSILNWMQLHYFFSVYLSSPVCLTRLSMDHIRSVITFQPLFSADISVQLIVPILSSRTGQSVCEWEEGKCVCKGEREGESKMMKLHVNCACLLGCLRWAPSWLYVCVCISWAFACIIVFIYLYWICVINLSVCCCICTCVQYMCLFLQSVMAQYTTRVMMCKVMMCSHPLSPAGSQPLALDAPLHTLVCMCAYVCVFQANLAGVCSLLYPLQAVCCLLFLL